MIGPALQGAQLISNIGRAAPWILTGASMLPGIINAAGNAFNRPPAPYNPGGGGMGGRRGTAYRRNESQQQQQASLLGRVSAPGEDKGYWRDSDTIAVVGSPAAERAYQTEASRVAQMTAQNPDLQRYEAARKIAVAPGATPEQVQSAEDIGMQVWAKANPKLAAKVRPGQSGYDAIQGALAGNMARAGQGFALPEQLSPTPQGFPTQVPALPTGKGFGSGFSVQQNLAPGSQALSSFGAPATAAQNLTSPFSQPNVVDAAKFQELLKLIGK